LRQLWSLTPERRAAECFAERDVWGQDGRAIHSLRGDQIAGRIDYRDAELPPDGLSFSDARLDDGVGCRQIQLHLTPPFNVSLLESPDHRNQVRVEIPGPFGSQPTQGRCCALGLLDQVRNVDAAAFRRERPQAVESAPQELRRAHIIAALRVVEGNPYLEYALVKITDAGWFGFPELFEGLVAGEELAPIELADPLNQKAWRRLRAVVLQSRALSFAST